MKPENNIKMPQEEQAKVYSVYARSDNSGKVYHIFSNYFEEPTSSDILVKSGSGDEYIHVGYYEIYTIHGAHNYKIEKGKLAQCTEEEINAELKDKAEAIRDIYAADLNELESISGGRLNIPGWYRVAKYPGGDGDAFANSCEISIKRSFENVENEYHNLKLVSVTSSYEFKPITNKSVVQLINKIRYTHDDENDYIEIYYSGEETECVHISIIKAKDYGCRWKAIIPELIVEEDTTIVEYVIPDSNTVITSLDVASDSAKLGGETAKWWNEKIENVQNRTISQLSARGWYRVAKFIGDSSTIKGSSSNGCDIQIKRKYNNDQNEMYRILLDSTSEDQQFKLLSAKSDKQCITKIRYTYDIINYIAYLELFYDSNTANEVEFGILNPASPDGVWKTINAEETLESVGEITVSETYEIPANATPLTNLDLEKFEGKEINLPLLEMALTLDNGFYNFVLGGAKYIYGDLPDYGYAYGFATIHKRSKNTISVTLWGSTSSPELAVCYYGNDENGEPNWTDWFIETTQTSLANTLTDYLRNDTDGEIDGNLTISSDEVDDRSLTVKNSIREADFGVDKNGDIYLSDGTNKIIEAPSAGVNKFFGTSSNSEKLGGYLPTHFAELGEDGKVMSSQLPSYVDDVLEFSEKGSFPDEGESGKIYVAQDTNLSYRWTGSTYVEISSSLALGENSSTAYRGDRGKIAYDHSQTAHAPSNAEPNQNAFSNVKVGDTTITADGKTDTLTLAAGDNVILTPDEANNKVVVDVPIFKKSGENAAAGLVPTPPSTAGKAKFLREDGAWIVPSGDIASYSITMTTGATSLGWERVAKSSSGDYTVGLFQISATISGECTTATIVAASDSANGLNLSVLQCNHSSTALINKVRIVKDNNSGDVYFDINITSSTISLNAKIIAGFGWLFSDTTSASLPSAYTDKEYNLNANGITATTFYGNLYGIATDISSGAGIADAYRRVWFSNSSRETQRAYDDDFMYNPVTNTLKVGKVKGDLEGTADSAKTANVASTVTATSGTADAYRNVWFSSTSGETIRANNGNFMYNPATETLKVGKITGKAASLYNVGLIDTQSKLDAFISGSTLQYATMNNISSSEGFAASDGAVLSIPWSSDGYGHQIFFDDTSYTIQHRYKSSSWAKWVTLLDTYNFKNHITPNDIDAVTKHAHYYNTSSAYKRYFKININTKQKCGLSFKIKVYGYNTIYEINVSGYCDGIVWSSNVSAKLLYTNMPNSIGVIFGYDTSNLWVAIPACGYSGVDIYDVLNGDYQIEITKDLFTITNTDTLTGTAQYTVTAYRPFTSEDIIPIYAGGTGAATEAEARTKLGITPANIGAAPSSHNHEIVNVNGLETALNNKVPKSTTVNGKALSGNISLTPSDVGADPSGSAKAVQDSLDDHKNDTDVHFTPEERTKLSGIATGANKYTHPTSGVTAGTYKSVTVDVNGHVTKGTNPTTLAGYGITDAEAKGTASSTVSSHNTSSTAHNDIRTLITELTTRLNALANSDDTTLDQMSEIVEYIKNNKSLIDSITTSKVNVSDIVNNLTTDSSKKPLSAAQGVAIKKLIDDLNTTLGTKAASTDLHAHSNKSVLDATTASYTTAEKTKLSGIATGAEVNQNAFSNVKVGDTTIAADSKTDTLTLAAGDNITLTPDASGDKVTITAKDTTYSAFVKSGSGAKAGLVPAPSTTAGTTKYLREDGTWVKPPNTTYSAFVKSGSGAKAGLVPAPSTTAGTTKYLREDGTWAVPPDTNTVYTHPSYTAKSSGLYKITVDASGHVSAVTAVAKADITALGIPSSNTTYSTFVKSGSGAAAGLVPAPPTTAGTTKYLREDGTWVKPPNSTYSLSSFSITASATEINYTKGVTSAIQTQLDGKVNKRENGYRYSNIISYYTAGTTPTYYRIKFPDSIVATWTMLNIEVSLRQNYNNEYGGKVLINAHHNNTSTAWTMTASTLGVLTSDIKVYGSDGKYIYIGGCGSWSTISIDNILVGDAATSLDISAVTIDIATALPSTYQTATMYYGITSQNIGSQSVSYASSAGAVAWANVTGKPSSFTPASHNHDSAYVNVSGDTMTGKLEVQSPIFGYNYKKAGNNAPAFVFDKSGSNYTGIGANGEADTIYFGAVSSGDLNAWVTTYKQKWKFNGSVIADSFTGSLNGNASSASAVAWANVTGKPSSFTPASHTHTPDSIGATYKHAHAYNQTHQPGGYYKININATNAWMLSFKIRVYQDYRATEINVSGYNYGSSYWYSPAANIISDSNASAMNIYFGYDATYKLWVAIPAGSYTGLDIFDVVNGYIQIDSFKNLFTITHMASLSGTLQTTVTAYPPFNTGNVIPIGNGGTGATSAAAARSNLGAAAASHGHTTLTGVYTSNGGSQPPSYVGANSLKCNMMATFVGTSTQFGNYADVLLMNAYSWSDVPYATALAIQKTNGVPKAWIASGGNTSSWAGATELITANNIASQSVASASAIKYASQLGSDDAISNFLEANTLKTAIWTGTSSPGVSNGMIISGGYTTTNYGFQLAIDDDPTHYMALRQKGTSGWSAWKRLAFTSDIPTSLPASDVYSWAKAASKPSYTYTEVGAAAASHNHVGLAGWSDTRSVATTPNDYNGNLSVRGIKTPTAVGGTVANFGNYATIMGIRGWSDSSGGDSHELAFAANGTLWHRHGATTSFGTWGKVYTSQDKPTLSELGIIVTASDPGAGTASSYANGTLIFVKK